MSASLVGSEMCIRDRWSTIAVGATIPYSVARATRAVGRVVFGTVSRCGSAGCAWLLSPKEYAEAEAVAPR
eukprot:14712389-Alexandrium_andersonii.AAC.1